MFAKVFSQIYDSSIVENPSVRFTFMDLLVLADRNGVVDMTHEAIARRTNRPIETIRKTILQLESPDNRSRTPDCNGARLKRLDDHRDWGWMIVNYHYFRQIASEEQRREKTLERVHKHRKTKPLPTVTHCNASNAMQRQKEKEKEIEYPPQAGQDFKTVFEKWMQVRRGMGKKPKDWVVMFQAQLNWIAQQPLSDWIEICEQSIRNGWQGLFAVKPNGAPVAGKPKPKYRDVSNE